MIAYLTIVGRCFKNDKKHVVILKKTRPLFTSIRKSFDGIITTRGKHVHIARLQDESLDRLDMLDLLVSSGSDKMSETLGNYYVLIYRDIRRKWKNTFKNNEKSIKTLLDHYAEVLLDILFTKQTNRFRYPKGVSNI